VLAASNFGGLKARCAGDSLFPFRLLAAIAVGNMSVGNSPRLAFSNLGGLSQLGLSGFDFASGGGAVAGGGANGAATATGGGGGATGPAQNPAFSTGAMPPRQAEKAGH
jgi:hypothetical protein